MTADQELSIAHHFADLTDPRIDRSRLHERLDLVTIAICLFQEGAQEIGFFHAAWYDAECRHDRPRA